MVAAAVGIGTAVAGLGAAAMNSSAAKSASNAQVGAANAGISEQDKQFQQVQTLLAPYVTAGNGSLAAQQNLLGIGPGGAQAQQAAYNGVMASPAYTSALAEGNRNILANASATGGLRGGNTQAALGQFAPQLLASTIQQQYGNLAGITSLGQNAAAGVGNAGLSTGNSVTQLLQQSGAATAGGDLASSGTPYLSALTSALGTYGALGGFKTTQPVPTVTSGSNPNGYNGTVNNPSAYVGGPF